MNLILAFIRHVLCRFAKTFGCIFLVAGFAVAAWLYQLRVSMVEAARYHPSSLLEERLNRLQSTYGDSQRLVMQFKDAADFPANYSAASFKPNFPSQFSTAKDFQDLHAQLAQVSKGKDEMKRFLTDHVDFLLNDIQQKLLIHAASLASPAPQPQKAAPQVNNAPEFGLYDAQVAVSDIESRKSTLDDAKQYLGVIGSSAEDPDNKKTLADSIAEIDALAKLFPSPNPAASLPQPAPLAIDVKEPLNAEKAAARIAQIRSRIRRAVLSSWALDQAAGQAIQVADEEQAKFLAAEFRAKQLNEELRIQMALAVTAGMALGVFFLLIGDWTQKSSTELLADPWCQLIENFNASPKDVYAAVEKSVAARNIPGLETTHEFWHEGGAISAQREYLCFARERLVFEICAAPFGTGFFLSFRAAVVPLIIDPLAIFCFLIVVGAALGALVSVLGLVWGPIILVFALCVLLYLLRALIARGLADVDRFLMKTPLLGPLYELFLRHDTYYRLDTRAMYVQAVQNAVSEAFHSMFGDQKVDLLPGTVSKPVLEAIYRRRF
ncbi:MAG: hypothetical protein WDN67_04880 [Candidatus Moraniibacteriota bacterium]